ncbi:hypothetical protein EG329_006419 [Mollisiaceae sp. DMI_Dod_QoI]|nr:hypothetical protein EG329_006419 [Helotiales sp. DMI_Dod_QoI]
MSLWAPYAPIPENPEYKKKFLTSPKASITLIALIWIMLATYVIPRAYDYWALFTIELLFLAAWVNGFLFAFASGFRADGGCEYIYNHTTGVEERHCKAGFNQAAFGAAANSSQAVIGLAGALMVLWLVSLIVVSVFITRHRRAGGRHKPEREAPDMIEVSP